MQRTNNKFREKKHKEVKNLLQIHLQLQPLTSGSTDHVQNALLPTDIQDYLQHKY